MNYELAKQLKEAGFPQDRRGAGRYITPDGGIPMGHVSNWGTEVVYRPTLSELIEACGNEVGVFKISDTECNAWSKKLDRYVDDESNDFNCFTSTTPDEAVARLWLALNRDE